jgi:hypothetical protein
MISEVNQVFLPIYLFIVYFTLWLIVNCTEHIESKVENDLTTEVESTSVSIETNRSISKDYSSFSMKELKQIVEDAGISIPKGFDRRYKDNWASLAEVYSVVI